MVGIKMTKAIWELVNPAFKEVFYGFWKRLQPKNGQISVE